MSFKIDGWFFVKVSKRHYISIKGYAIYSAALYDRHLFLIIQITDRQTLCYCLKLSPYKDENFISH